MRPGHASPPLQPRRGQRPHRYPRGLAGTPRLPLPAPKASPQAPRMQCSRPASSNAGGCAMLHVALVAMRSAVVRRWFGFGSVSRRQPGSGGFLAVAEDGFASKTFGFVCLFGLLACSLQHGFATGRHHVRARRQGCFLGLKQAEHVQPGTRPPTVRAVPLAASRHRAASSHAVPAIQGHVSCRPDRRLIDEPDG
jgi:hypothetical protein